MKRILIFFLAFLLLISNLWASEWGILELKTEVSSGNNKTLQSYSFLLEKWWGDSLGISMNFSYENYLKYRLGMQTPYIRGIYGSFYPNLNFYTKYLNFRGLFLGLYILQDEVYFLTGEDLSTTSKINTLGWQRTFTPHNLGNFSITSYGENYILDINLLQKYNLPLGICYSSEELSFLIKNSQIYLSGVIKGEITLGNFSLKGYLGTNHSQNLDLSDIKPGEFGGEISLKAPLSLNILNGLSVGYFQNFDNGVGRLKLGNSLEWKISDYLNIESSSYLEYLFSSPEEYTFSQSIQVNLPTMEGSLVGSIYWKKDENQTIGLKISYQF
ncbi:MAG: hypothetical protein ACPLKX_00235 [Dictyoglomaceae bacterium]